MISTNGKPIRDHSLRVVLKSKELKDRAFTKGNHFETTRFFNRLIINTKETLQLQLYFDKEWVTLEERGAHFGNF